MNAGTPAAHRPSLTLLIAVVATLVATGGLRHRDCVGAQPAPREKAGRPAPTHKPTVAHLITRSKRMHKEKKVFPDDFRPDKDPNLLQKSDMNKYMMPSVWSETADIRGGGGGFYVPIVVKDEATLREMLRKYIRTSTASRYKKTVRLDEVKVDEHVTIHEDDFYFRITPPNPDDRTKSVIYHPFVVLRSSLLKRTFTRPRDWRRTGVETDIVMGREARKDVQRFQRACDLLFFAMFKYFAHGSEGAPDAGGFLLSRNAGGGRVLKTGVLAHRRVEDAGANLRWIGVIGYKHTRLTRSWPPDDGKVHIPEPPAWFFRKFSKTTWHLARMTMSVDRQTGRLAIVRDRYPKSKGPLWDRQELTAGKLMLVERERLITQADAAAWEKRRLPDDFPPAKQFGPIRKRSGLLRPVSLLLDFKTRNAVLIDDFAKARTTAKTRVETSIRNFRHPTQRVTEHKLVTADSNDVCHRFVFSYTCPTGVYRTTYVVLRPKAFERVTGHPSTWMPKTSPRAKPGRGPRRLPDRRPTSDVVLTAAARTDRELFTHAVDLVVYLIFRQHPSDFLLSRSVDADKGKLGWTGILAELPYGNQIPRSKQEWSFSNLLIAADPGTGKLTFTRSKIDP